MGDGCVRVGYVVSGMVEVTSGREGGVGSGREGGVEVDLSIEEVVVAGEGVAAEGNGEYCGDVGIVSSIFLMNLLLRIVILPDPSVFNWYFLNGRTLMTVPDFDHLPFS